MSSFKRWYDEDPALSKAMDSLRQATDAYQAQVALNIIKVVWEHYQEIAPEALSDNPPAVPTVNPALNRRWYDVNETLHSAMQLLQETPPEVQRHVIPSLVRMIETTLAKG